MVHENITMILIWRPYQLYGSVQLLFLVEFSPKLSLSDVLLTTNLNQIIMQQFGPYSASPTQLYSSYILPEMIRFIWWKSKGLDLVGWAPVFLSLQVTLTGLGP
jgi:hypothetical protein